MGEVLRLPSHASHGTPEQVAAWCEEFGNAVPAFVAEAAGTPGAAPRPTFAEALCAAHVPPVTASRMGSLRAPIPPAVVEWAGCAGGASRAWLWLSGAAGTGKTCAAAWAVATAVTDGAVPSAGFVAVRRLVEAWDACDRFGPSSKARAVARWSDAPLLALDGLGEEEPTASTLAAVLHVVSERHDAMLPTVVTSQLSGREYRDRLARFDRAGAAALFSRLMHGLAGFGSGEVRDGVCELGGADMRLG